MEKALFDKLHDTYLCERTKPATIEEFIAFGLQPKDYVHYIGLQQRLQGELLVYGFPNSHTSLLPGQEGKVTYPALEDLVAFCKEKNLVSPDCHFLNKPWLLSLVERDDAEYFHGWLQYPKDAVTFRLAIERKLSTWWDEEDAYISETYGAISFDYDARMDSPEDCFCIPADSPIRIKRYNPNTEKLEVLNKVEVKKLYETAKKEKAAIERKIDDHLVLMPPTHDATAVSAGLPWLKTLYALCEQQEIIENVFERIEEAVNAPDIYEFKNNDVLFVFCGTDTCRDAGHLLSDIRVDFNFHGKPNKQYTIKRCSHCKQFRISLQDLINMYDGYGVPCGIILYDDDLGEDFSDFPERSFYYQKGYSVSQTAGLSTLQRQHILQSLIKTGKRSKYQVMDFLKRRMNINGAKPGNELAFQKWKEDYEFVRKL